MGNSNIGTLILYKQHYRDNYNNEASLPENQLFSTFGYYDLKLYKKNQTTP